jgi:hypothetical protein
MDLLNFQFINLFILGLHCSSAALKSKIGIHRFFYLESVYWITLYLVSFEFQSSTNICNSLYGELVPKGVTEWSIRLLIFSLPKYARAWIFPILVFSCFFQNLIRFLASFFFYILKVQINWVGYLIDNKFSNLRI